MKRIRWLLVLMFLLMISSVALAEEAVRLWDAKEINGIEDEVHDQVVIFRGGADRLYGIAALDGTTVIEPVYESIDGVYALPGYYRLVSNEGVNRYSVLDSNGQIITTDTYIQVEAESDKWLICAKAIPAENEEQGWDFQVRSNGEWVNYIAERYDIYYLPEGKAVGQLTREQYRMSAAYGDYLLVENDEHQLQLYNAAFAPVESTFRSTVDDEYTMVDQAIVSHITGEEIARGYYFPSELTDELMAVSLYKHSTGVGIMNKKGEIVLEMAYSYINNIDYYGVLLVKKDGLCGAFNPETLTLELPCIYSDVMRGYCIDGVNYYFVEQDGVVGYATSQGITSLTSCKEDEVTLLGGSLYTTAEDGTITLVAADGTVTPLSGVTEVKACERTQGRYIEVKNAQGLWGLMNWHGEMIVDFCEKYSGWFGFVDGTHYIYRDAMYEIQTAADR